MPRTKRADEAGAIYRALNRGNARATIFHKEGDDAAFERILAEGLERYPARLLAYQLMPNHWNLVLQPTEDGGMSNLLRWVTAYQTRQSVRSRNVGGIDRPSVGFGINAPPTRPSTKRDSWPVLTPFRTLFLIPNPLIR